MQNPPPSSPSHAPKSVGPKVIGSSSLLLPPFGGGGDSDDGGRDVDLGRERNFKPSSSATDCIDLFAKDSISANQ